MVERQGRRGRPARRRNRPAKTAKMRVARSRLTPRECLSAPFREWQSQRLPRQPPRRTPSPSTSLQSTEVSSAGGPYRSALNRIARPRARLDIGPFVLSDFIIALGFVGVFSARVLFEPLGRFCFHPLQCVDFTDEAANICLFPIGESDADIPSRLDRQLDDLNFHVGIAIEPGGHHFLTSRPNRGGSFIEDQGGGYESCSHHFQHCHSVEDRRPLVAVRQMPPYLKIGAAEVSSGADSRAKPAAPAPGLGGLACAINLFPEGPNEKGGRPLPSPWLSEVPFSSLTERAPPSTVPPRGRLLAAFCRSS